MGSDKLLDNLLEDKNNIFATEDALLAPLLPVIDQINDTGIRMFVRSVLVKAAPFFWTTPADLDHNNYPQDEKEEGGLVLHTIRVARLCSMLATIQDRTPKEHDILLAAALLHDTTKATEEIDGSVGYDVMHAYTVDGLVDYVQEHDDKYSNDTVSSTLYIDEESLQYILRIIRCQKGAYSIVPETIPISSLELTLAIADAIGGKLPYVVDGVNVQEWRWKNNSDS